MLPKREDETSQLLFPVNKCYLFVLLDWTNILDNISQAMFIYRHSYIQWTKQYWLIFRWGSVFEDFFLIYEMLNLESEHDLKYVNRDNTLPQNVVPQRPEDFRYK